MNTPRNRLAAALAGMALAGAAPAAPVDNLQAGFRDLGAGPFSAEHGALAWSAEHQPEGGEARSCAACHGTDLTRPGKHLRTGKAIEPMAPSVNPKRLSSERGIRIPGFGRWDS